MIRTLALVLALAAGAVGAPQGGGEFSSDRPPRGTVRDEAGKPLADVRLRFEFGGVFDGGTFGAAMAEAWREMPVPEVVTGPDGRFVWPLLREQRLAFPLEGQGRVVFERDGYQPWSEPLTAGLAGYLGSEVVLRAQCERETLVVPATAIPEGGRVLVCAAFGVSPRWVDPEAGGGVPVTLPRSPSPLCLQFTWLAQVGWSVQIVRPGASTQLEQVVPEDDGWRWRASAAEGVGSVRVRAADGRELVGLRSMHTVARERSWFDALADDSIAFDDVSGPPEAVVAEGMLALDAIADGGGELVLRPVPNPDADQTIEFVDGEGRAVPGVQARLWRDPGDRLRPARPLTVLGVAGGAVVWPASHRRDMAWLEVVAPHHELASGGRVLFDPRDRTRVVLREERRATVVVRVLDDRGEPVARALIQPETKCYNEGFVPWGSLRTDAEGRCRVGALPAGKYLARVAAPGKTMAWARPEIDEAALGGTVHLDVHLRDAVPLKVRAVDAAGEPLAFEAFALTARVEKKSASNAVCCTDSAGRLFVPDRWGGVDVELDRRSLFGEPREVVLRTSNDVHEVEVDRVPLVRVLLRPGAVVRGLSIDTGPGGGSSGMGVELPASEVLLRMGPGAESATLKLDDGTALAIPVDKITAEPEQVVDLRGEAK